MANNQNTTSTILSEHRRIVGTRYILATLNFLAVLLGMIVTLFFVSRRGIYDAVLTVIWVLIIINVIQIVLCLGEYILRSGFGINIKVLPMISYIVGALWVVALVLEMVLATIEAGTLRTDLLIVAAIQAVVAIVAYILWPNLDRRAIDSMIKPSSRGDEKKRAKKAKRYVATYGVLTVLIVLAQAATLLLYKMPPTFYDLFADNRALQYELNEDKDGYIVSAVYNGTSPYVNIPATYNNLPVVGIKSGALVDDGIIEKYKITSITFGTPEKDENGNEVMKSNLQFINAGAIVCSRVESLSIPESVTAIEDGAIRGGALRTVEYSARANFKYSAFSGCDSLARILMSGEHVGVIASLEGMPERVNIQVDKDIYNAYRESNLNYVSSFSPILADDEFCIDFFTGCDYYIDSIFAKKGESVKLNYADLKKDGVAAISPAVDTLAYIKDAHELGTDGAKADSAFRGWYYDGNYVAKVDFTEFGEISLTESTKIYAKWINEYNATLDWGTYKPAGQVDKIYWTEEDDRSFPVVTDRNGYSKGVVWTKAGTDVKLENSDGITESIALIASWQFDAPTISLDYVLNGGTETITVGGATFVYDEYKKLQLSAVHSHALESDQINNTVDYDYEWFKDGIKLDAYSNTDVVRLQNVRESGVYTLRVTATPHYYADAGAYAEINYNVQITKKPIDLGDVKFDYLPATKHFVYNSGVQTCTVDGNPVTQGIVATYTYSKDGYNSTSGMIDAGEYTVSATYAKVDPAEAENYDTATLTTVATVKPIVLASPTWSNSSFLYNKSEHNVYISFAEAIAGEDVGVIYEGGSATDAGNYTAIVTGVTNANYTLVGVDANKLSCSWEITKRPITVQGWYLDGMAVTGTTYNGMSHEMIAAPSGAMSGDNVTFVYASSDNDITSATNAGTYTARITGVNNSNYELSVSGEDGECTWTIAPAKLTVTFNNHGRLVYNGTQQTISATVAGIVAADVSKFNVENFNTTDTTASVSLAEGDDDTSVKLLFGATNVAAENYVAKINGLNSGEQHLKNYVIESAKSQSFNIEKKLLNVRPVDGVYTYDGEDQHMLLMVEGVIPADRESISFTIGEGGRKVDDVTHGVFIDYVGKDAGSYPTSITAVDDSNYTITAYTKPLTVNKREVTVAEWTMFDKAKGALIDWNENGYEYNKAGYKVGYTLSGVVEGEGVTLSLTNAEKENASNNYYVTTATLDSTNDVNKNYTFAGDSTNWKINPRSITLTWKVGNSTDTSFVYSKQELEAKYEVKGILEGDSITLGYKTGEGVLSATNVGDYKITVTSISNTNYTLSDGDSFEWCITPKPVDLVWKLNGDKNKTSFVYNSNFHEVEVSVNLDDIMSGDTVLVNTTGTTAAANANSYSVTAESLGNANYVIKNTTVKEFNWEITALPIEVIWDSTTEFIYNSQNQYPKATITNLCGSDVVNMSYTNYGKDVGTYKVRIQTLDTGNYTFAGATGIETTYTIVPKVIDPVWTINSFVYNAEEKAQYANPTYGATASDDGKVYNGDSVDFEYLNNRKTDAGTYIAKVVGTGNKNYVLTSDTAETTYEWAIAKCPVTLTWKYNSVTYNSDIQYPTATVSNRHGQSVKVTAYSGTGKTAEAKGSYSITADGLDNSNFTLVGGTGLTQTYEIKPLTLTYEWYGVKADNADVLRDINNLVYDGYQTRVLVRFTNLCDGDDIEAVYAHNVILDADQTGKTVTVTLDGDDVDNYTFPDGGISKTVKVAPQPVKIAWYGDTNVVYNGNSHKLTATVVGKKAGVDHSIGFAVNDGLGDEFVDAGTHQYTITITDEEDAKNFTLVGCEGSSTTALIIAPKPVTVIWSELNHVYDGVAKTVIATSSEVDVNMSNNVQTNANSYTVTATSADKNYVVENGSATFVIEKAKLQAIWSGSLNPVYNGASRALSVSVTNAKNPSVLPTFTVRYNGNPSLTPINAGNYTATIVFTYSSDSANFEFADPDDASRTLVIEQKTVDITGWSKNSFVYDSHIKTLTAFVNDATAQLQLRYTQNTLTTVGEIPVTAYFDADSNYKLRENTEKTKNLCVTKATVTVDWGTASTELVYSGLYHKLQPVIKSDSEVDVPTRILYNGTERSQGVIDADIYKVSIELKDSENFKFSTQSVVEKTLTIAPKVVTVSWPAQKVYTYNYTATRDFAATIQGIGSDNVAFVYDVSTKCSDAGVYPVSIIGLSGSASGNYKLPEAGLSETFTINPCAVTVEWSSLEYTYDTALHRPTVRVIGADYHENISHVPLTSYVNAGTYGYEIELTNSNYTLKNNNNTTATMVIKPREAFISWPTLPVAYDGTSKTLKPTVLGVDDIELDVIVTGAAGKTVGNYEFTVTEIVDNDNYTLVGVDNTTGILTIAPREVTISWSNLEQTLGMMSDTLRFATLENVVVGDEVYPIVENFRTTLQAGECTLYVDVLAGEDSANYTIAGYAEKSAILVIKKQRVTATWFGVSATYNGTSQAPQLIITDRFGENLSDTLVKPITGHTDAGEYSYWASDYFLDNLNYELESDVQCNFVINKKQIKTNDFTVIYDKETASFSVAFNGLPENDKNGVTVAADKLDIRDASGYKIQNGTIETAGTYMIKLNALDIVASENYELSIVTTAQKYDLTVDELA